MSYYLVGTNFYDKQSIINNNMTDLIKIGKYAITIHNDNTHPYAKSMKMSYDCEKLIKKLIKIFNTINYDDELYQSYKKLFNEKYAQTKIVGEVYNKEIRILLIDDKQTQKIFVDHFRLYGQLQTFNPTITFYENHTTIPWWVSYFEFHFPYHGGDDETYYFDVGFTHLTLLSHESAYTLSYKYFIVLLDDKEYKFTLGRSAHS